MASQKNDLAGKRFGALTALRISHQKNRRTYWLCTCDCGKDRVFGRDKLTTGVAKSCGCLSVFKGRFQTKHGQSVDASGNKVQTPEYRAWCAMKQRCSNPNVPAYKHYGGRGIMVSEEWKDDFSKFLDHVGQRPGKGYSLDRINCNGNYEPGNVRWASQSEQCRNTRVNNLVTVDGITKPVIDWSDETGVSPQIMYLRTQRGDKGHDVIRPANTRKKI